MFLPNFLFSHPDFTVGFGISPNQPPKRVADYTAGRESHPAPKNLFISLWYYNALKRCVQGLFYDDSICHDNIKN